MSRRGAVVSGGYTGTVLLTGAVVAGGYTGTVSLPGAVVAGGVTSPRFCCRRWAERGAGAVPKDLRILPFDTIPQGLGRRGMPHMRALPRIRLAGAVCQVMHARAVAGPSAWRRIRASVPAGTSRRARKPRPLAARVPTWAQHETY